MTQFMVAHEDGLHRVYRTETGVDRSFVVDAAYAKPRQAIDHAGRLNGETTGSPVGDGSLRAAAGSPAPTEAPVRDTADASDPDGSALRPPGAGSLGPTTSAGATDPAPDTVARNAAVVRTDAGHGGPTPPGRRGRCRPSPEAGLAAAGGGLRASRTHRASEAVPTPSGGLSHRNSPLGVRARLPGADPGTHPPGV